jgi:putative endonuclease
MLASGVNGTLYIGVTSSLHERVTIHKRELLEGFSKQYGVHVLVYYEMCETMELAISREKQLKKWNRLWKIRLIEEMNPQWCDLYDEVGGIEEGAAGGQSEFGD